MQNRKKIAAIASALAVAIGLTAVGSYAYFVETHRDSATGKAGEVEIAPEDISINSARLYVTKNGYEFDTNQYKVGGQLNGASGWYPVNSTTTENIFVPFVWIDHRCDGTEESKGTIQNQEDGSFKCDNCNKTWTTRKDMFRHVSSKIDPNNSNSKTWGHSKLTYNSYFRTSDGKVVYCADAGKKEPDSTSMEMSEEINDVIKRILIMGYPNKTISDEQYSDLKNLDNSDLERATQQAIYIAEGTFYNKDGSLKNTATTEEYINKNYIVYPYEIVSNPSIENYNKAVNKTEEFKTAIHRMLEYANDESIDVQDFSFNCSLLDIQMVEGGRLFGPYNIETNITSDINLSSTIDGVEFRNLAGETITSINGSNQFYAFVPTNVNAEIDITAEAPGVTVIPSYYYGNGDMTVQKMLIASPVPAKVTAHIGTVKELMPGDVIDISWVVENKANKAVVTRNKVYVWWEDEDSPYSNAIENTHIYQQNVDSKKIMEQMWNETLTESDLLKEAGEVHTFSFDGDKDGTPEEHIGYEFTMYGDWLDGVGDGAEIFRPGTTDIHYGQGTDGEKDYNSLYDDNSYTTDTVSFKLGFSPYANIHTSGKNLRISVITEAIQWQNTIDEEFDTLDWSVIGRTDF